MKHKLTLLPDGDIEIHDEEGKRIYHKFYDQGDNLKKNLNDAYDFLHAAENPNFDREKYAEEQRKKATRTILQNFDRCLSKLINDQKDKTKPIYVIAKWWCGKFEGIEKYTTSGDEDLPDLKKEFDEHFAWRPGDFGITEQGYTIERIDVGMAFDDEGRPTCRACGRFRNGACQLYSFETREPCERFLLRGANK